MVKVRILNDFMVAASSEVYMKGWEGEVSERIAERHGSKGTGFLKAIKSSDEAKSSADLKKVKK